MERCRSVAFVFRRDSAIQPPSAGLTAALAPWTVMTAPCARLTRPVPLNERATIPGTATLCSPVPMGKISILSSPPRLLQFSGLGSRRGQFDLTAILLEA
jgi:hypothetical protein